MSLLDRIFRKAEPPAAPPTDDRLPGLPKWASIAAETPTNVSVVINADTEGYVAEWFKLLNVTQPDQYWLEVAYQCAKLDLQSALVGTEFDPRTSGKPAEFRFSRAPQYAQSKHEPGLGAERASKGREARDHYRRIRGRLPF